MKSFGGFHKRPVDLLKVPAGNQRSRFGSRRIRMILCGSRPEGRGSAIKVVSEPDFVCIFQAKGARGKGVA
jgi:hypothetical protein